MHDIIIRKETPADRAAIFEVNLRAFGQSAEATLVDALRRDGDFIPELSLVAVVEGRVAGHILFPPITITSPESSVPALALAPMAVRPEIQRCGVGSRLVWEGVAACRHLGHRIVVVTGHPEYYPRFGFSPARVQGIEAPFPVPDEAFMVMALVEGAFEDIHGTMQYPPAFGALAE